MMETIRTQSPLPIVSLKSIVALTLLLCSHWLQFARAQGGGGGMDLGDLNMNNLGLGDLGNLGGGGGGANGKS